MTLRRRTMLATAGLATAGLSTAGALVAPHIGRAAEAAVLRFIPQSDLSVLDPIWSAAYVTRNHGMMVFDTLYGTDSTYRVSPQMAAGETTSDDGRICDITLRDGLLWHDGGKVVARDCVASIRRWGARDTFGQAVLAVTDEISAPDDKTIRFRLKRRFPLLLSALAKPGSSVCFMMPERLALTDPFRQVTEMIGSGPFRFKADEHIAGARTVYVRNPTYVPRPDGTPSFTAGPKIVHVERVEWTVIPDAATAAAAMQAGEMDWWEVPTFDLLALLRRNARLVVPQADPLGFVGNMRMNHLQPPFDNPDLRRAVMRAVSQEDYMSAAAGDPANWRGGVGVFCPASPMAGQAGMQVLNNPRDLAAVKQAVAASGYNNQRTVLLIPTDLPTLKALGDVGADLLKRIGMNVDPQYTDWGTVLQRLAKTEPVEQGGWSVFHTYWSGLDEFDPAVHTFLRGNGKAARPGWPTSEKLEALRNEWLFATDLPERQRIAVLMQRQAFIDVPFIPLGQILPPTVYNRSLSGVLQGYALFWNVRKS